MSVASTEISASQNRVAVVLFTLTIFLSASLLFFVQPLFAKIVLPVIGGSPAVWTTAMLFFQTVLICGYLYAHLSTNYLPPKAQAAVHLVIWAAALLFLPLELPADWRLNADGPIALQTLGLFAIGVGVPFALLSANAPLIQSWYSRSGGPSADDPYFLYAASNFGSLLALLAFPLLAEPFFGATQIAAGFSVGFVALGAGLLACGLMANGNSAPTSHTEVPTAAPENAQILVWLLLAFVPSSLMLAVTSKVSTDLGAIPLVWVIPLALYLLTFVLTFTGRSVFKTSWLRYVAQLAIVVAIIIFIGATGAKFKPVHALFLTLSFFAIALWAHRALYERRPGAAHLTKFYLIMSVGGALGGLFNSIIAPLLFSDLIEGTATLLVALLLVFQPLLNLTTKALLRSLLAGILLGALALILLKLFSLSTVVLGVIMLALTAMAFFANQKSFAGWLISVGTMILLPAWLTGQESRLFNDRSFFGFHQVLETKTVRVYSNGTTLHGAQIISSLDDERPTPMSYYHPAAPMGQIMQSAKGRQAGSVGIVGLGVGSLACYAQPGQDWHFYEIDSMVEYVARETGLFTFLSRCTPDAPIHMGDARVVLQDQPDLRFDVLVIDAYSSDSVPVHLTTDEAIGLYLDRLTDTGILVFHISNRYYDIGLPLARSTEARGLHIWRHPPAFDASDDPGYRPSDVALIARDPAHAADILTSENWIEVTSDGEPIWTDDRANALSILNPAAFQ